MTTGTSQGDWYLAYPTAAGTFRYRIHGSANFVTPTPITTGLFTRNGVAYSVFRFNQVTPGTTFDLEASS